MIACVFSGQGSQKTGMGQELCTQSPAARSVYAEAADFLGFDLLTLDDEQLAQTRFAQLSIVTMSLAAWAAFKESAGDLPSTVFAGFSLGEYSVLGAAGVLTLTGLLTLVDERARLMQAVSDATPGVMYAIMGMDDAKLLEVVGQPQYAGKVYAVNFNCPGQTVIAGLEEPAAVCVEALTAAGARKIRRLNVSGAFHTPLMQSAAEQLTAFARSLSFRQPSSIIYSNSSGFQLPADTDWPVYLATHMCSPVRWTDEVLQLRHNGAAAFFEFGPGKVLTGLIRKITPESIVQPVEDSRTLADALAALNL